jgi:hypothetical protein
VSPKPQEDDLQALVLGVSLQDLDEHALARAPCQTHSVNINITNECINVLEGSVCC